MAKAPTRKELILFTVTDLVHNFLYYDRKDDEQLSRGDIEKAIDSGEITVEEITKAFSSTLREALS